MGNIHNFDAHQIAQQPVADVLDIRGTSFKIRVVHRVKHRVELIDDGFRRRFRVDFVVFDRLGDRADKFRVFEEHAVGVENCRFFLAHFAGGFFLQRIELILALCHCGVKAVQFRLNVVNRLLNHRQFLLDVNDRPGDGNPRRRVNSFFQHPN